jgi:inosine-uridine nucleoside N-ribohydrolase
MYVTNPEVFKTQQGQIDVVVDAAGYGKTFFAPKGRTYAEPCWSERDNVHLCVEVDADGVLKLMEEYLSKGK